jgi:hypothetical protein
MILLSTALSVFLPHVKGQDAAHSILFLERLLFLPAATLGAMLVTRKRKKRRF